MKLAWRWVSVATAIKGHRRQIEKYGGGGYALRDPGRLEAAMMHLQMIADYEPDTDACGLAAAYAHGLAKGHPFVDGNKRIAWVVARLFLKKNGLLLSASQEEKYDQVYALAAGTLTETEFADWLRANTAPRK